MRASEIQPRKLVVFDIDDTLVYTQTKVHVVKDGKVVNSLNSHDFTHYKLKPGESFDFGDFSNAKEFFDNSKPNIPMMNQLKRDINTGNKVVMVTARSDFDDKELFLDTFRKFGVDIDKVHVYRAGNSKQGTTEERKKQIIDSLLNKDDYSKAIMYDDAKPNLHTFVELKKDHPKTRFYAWHVSLDGAASEYMREGIVAEKKRRKRRPRWAAYGPGPYGGYGYYAGYSGDGGSSGGDGGGGESIKHEASYPGNIGMMELAKFFQMADQSDKDQFKEFLERGKKGLAWKLVQDIVGVKLQGQEFDNVKEAEASDIELKQRYGDFDPEDKPMLPTTRVGGAPAPTLWTAYDAIENILGKNRVTDDEDDIEPGMYYVYQSSESPMFRDTEESGTGGSINIPNLDSKAARDVAMAVHEAYHAYVHDKTKGSGRVHANEKIINNLAEKWLRKHLSGTALHVAIETITGSRISYGQDHMPKSGVAKENFADGKNPGRKGLAKRSGVNTKASVSSLRKTAKSSTGEKARMAHWLANMKAGRAKKNK